MSEPKYGGGTIFMEPVAIRAEPIKVNIKAFLTRNNFCEGERRLLVQSNAIRSLGLPNTTRGMSSGGRREMGFQHLAARTGRRIHTTLHTWQFKHHLGFYLLIQYMYSKYIDLWKYAKCYRRMAYLWNSSLIQSFLSAWNYFCFQSILHFGCEYFNNSLDWSWFMI